MLKFPIFKGPGITANKLVGWKPQRPFSSEHEQKQAAPVFFAPESRTWVGISWFRRCFCGFLAATFTTLSRAKNFDHSALLQ
jgi:hypothetical protein